MLWRARDLFNQKNQRYSRQMKKGSTDTVLPFYEAETVVKLS